jgi:hypothetical protein
MLDRLRRIITDDDWGLQFLIVNDELFRVADKAL